MEARPTALTWVVILISNVPHSVHMRDGALEVDRQANRLLDEHGRGALQLLVDRIVTAVRAGDDAQVKELDATMRDVERLLEVRQADVGYELRRSAG